LIKGTGIGFEQTIILIRVGVLRVSPSKAKRVTIKSSSPSEYHCQSTNDRTCSIEAKNYQLPEFINTRLEQACQVLKSVQFPS